MKKENTFKIQFNEYALPMITRSIFGSIMHTADRIIAGIFIGSSALVATTLVMPVLYFIYGLSALFIGGYGAYVGLLIGKGEIDKAKGISSGILLLLVVLGLFISTPSILFSEEISIFLGAKGEIITSASSYLRVVSISFPIMLVARCIDILIYNDGSPKYSFRLGIFVTTLNLILNIISVALLDLGIAGLGISTVISETAMLIGCLNYYIFKTKVLKIAKPKLKLKVVVRIIYNGLSDFAMLFADSIMIFILNYALIKFLTPEHFEGYAVANVLIIFYYSIYMGASMGLQPIYSKLMGKEEFEKLKPLLFYSIKKTMIISLLGYIISIPISIFVLGLFIDSQIVLEYAKFFYITIGFVVMFSNLPLQTSSFFTSINRPIESMIISLVRTVVLIPIAAYISIMLMNQIGVAMGYLIADTILISLLMIYLKKLDVSKLKIYD